MRITYLMSQISEEDPTPENLAKLDELSSEVKELVARLREAK
jgi:outer membrane murein-binding lipoprotein Lpp